MADSKQLSPGNIKVLVVDDEIINAKVLAEILSSEGYQTSIATSGRQALEKVRSEKPNVVLLDVMMPDMDGFEVCRQIKSTPATVLTGVILVTALFGTEHRARGAQVGADDFITKPPDESELLARIRSLARIQLLQNALHVRNQQLSTMLRERTHELEQATTELQKIVEEKLENGTITAYPGSALPPSAPAALPTDGGLPHGRSETETVRQEMRDVKRRLISRLSDMLEGHSDLSRTPEMISMLNDRLASLYAASGLQLPEGQRKQLFSEIADDVLGYGPIEPLLSDPAVTEVMVNSPSQVFIETGGRLSLSSVRFDDNDHILRVIDRIIRPLGRRVDRRSPMVDARLPDGSRVNAVISPCALDGPSITVRKFSKDKLTVEDLIKYGSLTPEMARFLEACVCSRINTIVSGGTGSGKTTLLNVLSSFIPKDERIVTIEDSAELRLDQPHVVRLEAAPADVDGSGEITIRQLVKNSLRMRPDRIVVGEVRSGEALDMLQAMNTGHDGSLTTIHANSPRDTIARLETLVLMAGMDLPLKVVRAQITSAIDLIVQQARMRDGSRKVIGITEVQGMEGDVVVLSDIFVFKEKGMEDGRVVGEMEATGMRPKFTEKLEVYGFNLPSEIFMTPAQRDQVGSTRRR